MDNVELIAKLAVDAAQGRILDASQKLVILTGPDGRESLVGMEAFLPGRARFRGTYKTPFFNLGDAAAPGHGDWRAQLALEATAGYAALQAINGKPIAQRQMVGWCEDWAANLSARFADNTDSSITTALIAMRKLTIAAKLEATHTARDFGATRSTLEAVEAKSDNGLPTHLVFSTEPFAGFDKRDFALRLSVITSDKPALVLRIVSKEQIEESIAQEFKAKLLTAIGDAASMSIGSFTPFTP